MTRSTFHNRRLRVLRTRHIFITGVFCSVYFSKNILQILCSRTGDIAFYRIYVPQHDTLCFTGSMSNNWRLCFTGSMFHKMILCALKDLRSKTGDCVLQGLCSTTRYSVLYRLYIQQQETPRFIKSFLHNRRLHLLLPGSVFCDRRFSRFTCRVNNPEPGNRVCVPSKILCVFQGLCHTGDCLFYSLQRLCFTT